MTTNGARRLKRKGEPWNDAETAILKEMAAAGASSREIGAELGREVVAVESRKRYLRRTPLQRKLRLEREQAARAADQRDRKPRKPRDQEVRISPRAPQDALSERDRRYEAAARMSFTSQFFGDPPPGYSALDEKMQGRSR